jgi:hypothetical protein
MGLLLAFMFLLNMLGALILLPSLCYFLLPARLFKQAPRPSMPFEPALTDARVKESKPVS